MPESSLPASAPVRPSARLLRDGRLFAAVAFACLVVLVLLDVLAVAVMGARVGSAAGLLDGGFAFVLPWPGPDGEAAAAPGFVPITEFAVWQSTLAAGLLALRLAPGVAVLWSLCRLFGRYGRGEVFSERNAASLRAVAWALLAYAAVPLLTHAALYLAQMSGVALKLEVRQLDAAVAGVIVLAIARVMAFGCAIERDREGFV